jgi:hypothetical protein
MKIENQATKPPPALPPRAEDTSEEDEDILPELRQVTVMSSASKKPPTYSS